MKSFKEFITYETYLNIQSEFRNGFTTIGKDKILGGTLPLHGGNVVFIPKINLDTKEFTEYNDKKEACWTDGAIHTGERFIKSIIEIGASIRKTSNKTPKPEWLNHNSYTIQESIKIQQSIKIDREKISQLNDRIQKSSKKLLETEKLNDLLFETGKLLEEAVIYALKILGFKAEGFDNGVLELDQVIIAPEGWRFIGECEGKDNKSIDISKFRQLSDALNEDFERDEVTEKAYGLLFGNPFRHIPPSQRKSPFTEKCKNGAQREKIGLIETVELYRVSKYLMENKDERLKEECRQVIFEKLGEIITFPPLPGVR